MQKRKSFSREFKLEAVRHLESSGKPVTEVARELGVRRNQLYRWQVEFEASGEHAFPRSGTAGKSKQEDEVARLKRELERVKEERDILKKAAMYFAREDR